MVPPAAKRSEPQATAANRPTGAPPGVADPELVERPVRRRFTAEYKLRILREAEACTRPGEVGVLLRREGLYTSHLSAWRRQRDGGALEALGRPRGRRPADRRDVEIAELRRNLERTEAELAKARRVIEVQGNVSALLGQLLEPRGASEPGSNER
jgi:transposase-like protein